MFNNPYNFVRARHLHPVSIEMLAILIAAYFLYKQYRSGKFSLEMAYFVVLPFSDIPFRVASVQPVEFVSMLLIAANYRRLRLNWLLVLGFLFVVFAVLGMTSTVRGDAYSLLYSFRFILTGLVFSILSRRREVLSEEVLKFVVSLCFWMTFLQIFLWVGGLPIHGIFYSFGFPRAKGLAQEPATWSIFVTMIFPFVLHFKLGKKYVFMVWALQFMTFSVFGGVSIITFYVFRWWLKGGRINVKRWKRVIGTAAAIVISLLVISPPLLDSTVMLFKGFSKIVYYAYELTTFAGLNVLKKPDVISAGDSGRNTDLIMLKRNFPDNWLLGIGSFKADSEPIRLEGVNATNTYIGFLVETGVVGTLLIFLILGLHYKSLLRNRDERSADFLAAALNMFIMIAGIRCFAFHEIWYAQGYVYRTANDFTEEEEPVAAAISYAG